MLETNAPAQMVAKARCRNGRNGDTLAGPGEREAAVVTRLRYASSAGRLTGPIPEQRRKPLPCEYVVATGPHRIQGRAAGAGTPVPGGPPRRLDRLRGRRPDRHGLPAGALERTHHRDLRQRRAHRLPSPPRAGAPGRGRDRRDRAGGGRQGAHRAGRAGHSRAAADRRIRGADPHHGRAGGRATPAVGGRDRRRAGALPVPATSARRRQPLHVMGVAVEVVRRADGELAAAFAQLIPQLSSSSAVPDQAELRRIVEFPGNRLLVARDGGAIVGMLTLVVFPIPTGLRARIEDVVVDEAARGRGVGEALTREALRLAATAGARSVDLTSRPSREDAIRLYRRLGFEERASRVYRYSGPA